MSNKNFKIAGSITAKDIVVQGNLDVKGTTNTVNQETLTIKDNLIAVNGDGQNISAIGQAGLVIVDGKENIYLKDQTYNLDVRKLIQALGGESVIIGQPMASAFNNLNIDKFNNLNLYAPNLGYQLKLYSSLGSLRVGTTSVLNSTGILSVTIDNSSVAQIVTSINYSNDNIFVAFENQIISNNEDIEFIKQFLLTPDNKAIDNSYFTNKASAYASPIYDVNNDTLKIGLGSYEKDGNGNITAFTFGAGQGQSIATRVDKIENNRLLQWNSKQYRLEQSPITTFGKSIKVDGNIGAKGNFVIVNTDAESLDEANAAGTLSVTGKEVAVLKDGYYNFNYNAIGTMVSAEWDEDNYIYTWNEEFVNKFNNLNIIAKEFVYFGEDQGQTPIIIHIYPGMYAYYIAGNTFVEPGNRYGTEDSSATYYFENQIISIQDVEFLKQYMVHQDNTPVTESDFQIKGEAYASPIYNTVSGSLKIGQGTYERDFNGNVIKFEFGSGQGKELVEEWDGAASGVLTVRTRYRQSDGTMATSTAPCSTYPSLNALSMYTGDNEKHDSSYSHWKGYLLSLDPIRNYHTANKKYVDETTVTKVTTTSSYKRAYIIDEGGNQSTVHLSDTYVAQGTVPLRGPNGAVRVGTPVDNNHATPKSYVDSQDDTKLDKKTETTSNHQVYVKAASGSQLMFNIENGPVGSTICMRDGNARLRIEDPVGASDCLNLRYFNANKGTKLYKHSIDMGGGLGFYMIMTTNTPITVTHIGVDDNGNAFATLSELSSRNSFITGWDYQWNTIVRYTEYGITVLGGGYSAGANVGSLRYIPYTDVEYFCAENLDGFVDTVTPL